MEKGNSSTPQRLPRKDYGFVELPFTLLFFIPLMMPRSNGESSH